MRIIIVGCGKVGSELAGQLSAAGHDLTPVSYTHLDVYKRQSAGGGEAGCGLENRIYCERNLAAEHERQGTGHGQHQPAQRDCHKAFACVELGVFRLIFTQNACTDHTNQCSGDIGLSLIHI